MGVGSDPADDDASDVNGAGVRARDGQAERFVVLFDFDDFQRVDGVLGEFRELARALGVVHLDGGMVVVAVVFG